MTSGTKAPVKGLIFDKDGTLFEFAATWEAWAKSLLLRLSGGDADQATAIGGHIGFDFANTRFAKDSVVIAGTVSEIVDALAPHVPGHSPAELTAMLNDEAGQAPQIEAVPLVAFFAELKRRSLAIGVATNDAEAPARSHLAQAGVGDQLDFIAGYDSGFGGKPAPGQLLGFCAATGLNPEEVMMVGDSTHDLQAGRAAGMRCIGVLTGMAKSGVLAPMAEVVLDNIGQIPDWLDAHTR